jgi:site-specific recombinase XerD
MKHPYAHYLKQYMEFLSGHYAEITLKVRERRLNQFKKIIYDLKNEKKISTVSPRHLTSKDMATIVGHRKKAGLSSETILDDIAFLDGFLKFCGNEAVKKFKEEYPRFVPKTYHKRLEGLPDDKFNKIIECAYNADSAQFHKMRSYAVVIFCMCGGLRTLEIQHANVSGMDRSGNMYKLWLDVVKGSDTYGQSRWAPLLLQCNDFVDQYLDVRARYLKDRGIISDLLIPPMEEDVGMMSDKNIRKLKNYVCKDAGFKFDLRILRRTYAQYLIDKKVPLDVVQVALGHSNPNTMFQNYVGIRPEKVSDLVFEKLAKNDEIREK